MSTAVPVRFKDLEIDQAFQIELAWGRVDCIKIADNRLKALKQNRTAWVEIPIDPELNQDDCYPLRFYRPQALSDCK